MNPDGCTSHVVYSKTKHSRGGLHRVDISGWKWPSLSQVDWINFDWIKRRNGKNRRRCQFDGRSRWHVYVTHDQSTLYHRNTFVWSNNFYKIIWILINNHFNSISSHFISLLLILILKKNFFLLTGFEPETILWLSVMLTTALDCLLYFPYLFSH